MAVKNFKNPFELWCALVNKFLMQLICHEIMEQPFCRKISLHWCVSQFSISISIIKNAEIFAIYETKERGEKEASQDATAGKINCHANQEP